MEFKNEELLFIDFKLFLANYFLNFFTGPENGFFEKIYCLNLLFTKKDFIFIGKKNLPL